MQGLVQTLLKARFVAPVVAMAALLVPLLAAAQTGSTGSVGTWRSGFADDPHGGRRVPFISRSADLDSPDVDIVGLTVRCGQSGPEAILIVADPLPPRGVARVRLDAAGSTDVVEATPIPTGAGLVLPIDVQARAVGAWGRSATLTATVTREGLVSRASFSLDGFAAALARLESECMLAAITPL